MKDSLSRKNNIYYIIQKELVSCNQKGMIGKTKKWAGKMLLAANDIYDLVFEIAFAKKGIGLLKQIPIEDIDVMISTYGNVGGPLLALKFKKIKKELKWITDYRDPVRGVSRIKERYVKHIAAKVDREADFITGATKSCIGSGRYLEKFKIIYNGFDREDIKEFSVPQCNKKLQIVYTGNLYFGKSDMTLLFRIIAELQEKQLVDKNKIEIIYAGKQFYILEKQAEIFGLKDILTYKGRVSHKEALKLQYQGDILCALSWNNKDEDEILTGKILEYFMMEKPIIAIVSGDLPNSLLKRVIDEAEAGYCLEAVGAERQLEEAKQWFLEQYREFIREGTIKNHSDEKILEEYSSAKMAGKFGQLIDTCCDM